MIQLIPMELTDFEAFLDHEIIDYAQDKVRNGNWTAEGSLERSRREFQHLLPDGLRSKNQFIYSIVDESSAQKLGALWVEVKSDAAFIYDFVIEERFRGKGFGGQALAALDEKLLSMNVGSVGLHVFGDNVIAQELYKKAGYKVTNINMKKTLNG